MARKKPPPLARKVSEATQRTGLLAQIHIAQGFLGKSLGLENDDFAKIKQDKTGKASAAKMTLDELTALRNHYETLGWQRTASVKKHGKKPTVGSDKKALVDKIEALLTDAGRPWKYLTAKTEKLSVKDEVRPMSLLERITGKADDGRRGIGKERLEFCDAKELRKIVAALEYDAKRRAKKAGAAT